MIICVKLNIDNIFNISTITNYDRYIVVRRALDGDMPNIVFNISSAQKSNKLIVISETLLEIPEVFARNALVELGDARGTTAEMKLSQIFTSKDDCEPTKDLAKKILEKFAMPYWGDVCIIAVLMKINGCCLMKMVYIL